MIESAFNVLKVSAVIAISALFMVVISGLFNLVTSLVFGGFFTEFLGLVSMYLPFNASAVFGSIATAITAILSFLIAKKIFDLTSWSISAI